MDPAAGNIEYAVILIKGQFDYGLWGLWGQVWTLDKSHALQRGG